MARARLLLAGSQALVLEGFGALLAPQFEVVGTVADTCTLLDEARRLRPDAVLLEIGLPATEGLETGRKLLEALPAIHLVVVASSRDPRVAEDAMRMGATGYVLKSSPAAELRHALREALVGRLYVAPLGNDVESERVASAPRLGLTERQIEVLRLLAEGRSMKEVARRLNVTPRTVAFHKYKLMGQLHVRTTAELVRLAVKHGFVGH